jgi:hypothetical protein
MRTPRKKSDKSQDFRGSHCGDYEEFYLLGYNAV